MKAKETLISLVRDVVDKKLAFNVFSNELENKYWDETIHNSLEEIDNEFFYRVYENSTYVDDQEAGKWGLESTENYLKWLDRSFA